MLGQFNIPLFIVSTIIYIYELPVLYNYIMTARTHDAFAFASLITIAVLRPPESLTVLTLFTSIVGNIVGALIPDMDQATNRLWDLLPAGNTIGRIFRRAFFKHRTLSHSIVGGLLIYKFFEFVLPRVLNAEFVDSNLVLWSIMIGYGSHLLADSLTKEGLPLFFPFDLNIGFPPIEALRITTGKWLENFVVFPAVGIYIFWFVVKFQRELADILKLVA